jgi:hypothetical protein
MSEHLRKIASRLRVLIGNRRHAPRHRVQLPVFVSLLDNAAGAAPAGVAGQTCDASDSGLAIILPAVRVGGRYLVGDGITLRLTLKLEGASARLYGTAVRYERLEGGHEGRDEAAFLVGIHFNEDGDRALLSEYLKSLKK